HNGAITVESHPGGGTTFRLDLPALPDAPVVTGEPPERDVSVARVLVVDDEPSLRKVCQRLVASLGHECDTAESSAAAIELAKSKDFDLVLCDYRLATETADRVIAGFSEVAPALIERTG
ncbi:MAG TPA: response regulator, partial [Tepidiformaceae bacterium]|nr:response regulator [Tepidiformaceae bacterium]